MFGRYLVGVAVSIGLVAAVGCGRESSSGPQKDQPAGEVLEVTGTVTAELTASGKTQSRPLAVGDRVLADETIVTGPDSAVTIRLLHNDVRWSLGADKRKVVRQSAAWNAPKGGGDLLAGAGGDQTAVAGRHAEREAADTAATAIAADSKEEEKAATEPPADRERVRRDEAKKMKTGALGELEGEDLGDLLGNSDEVPLSGLGLEGTGRGGGGTGEGTIGLGSVGTIGHGGGGTGSGYGSGAGGGNGSSGRTKSGPRAKLVWGRPTVENIDKDVARRFLRRHTAPLEYCYEQKLTSDPKLAGSLVVKLITDASGKVAQVEVDGDAALRGAIGACVTQRLRSAQFPAAKDGGIILITTKLDFEVE